MLLRRLLGIVTFAALIGFAVWQLFYFKPQPDPRLVCYYGAYDFGDGKFASVTATTGVRSLRITFMDGRTWKLDPAQGGRDLPSAFTMSPGWTDEVAPGAAATFGACDEGVVRISGVDGLPGEGRRETFDVTDATFVSHGLKLNGRLVMPRVEGAVPVAVLGHGSESDSAVLFNRLQYLLPANGIGVFVFDKRGTGGSEGTYTQNFYWLADDMAAALKKAREMAGELASEVGFQGGSQAGWILPLAAGKAKTDFVVVGFGFAEGVLSEDREEVFDDLRSAGYGDAEIAKAREITDITGRIVASKFTAGFDELDRVRAKYQNEPWYTKVEGEYSGTILRTPNWLIRIVGPWYDVGTSWDYEPRPALDAYQGPHLWVLADRDSVAPSATTLRILREVQATHPNLDIVVFPNTDHGIVAFEEKDGERIQTRFAEGYFTLLADWIHFKQPQMQVQGPVVYDGEKQAAAAVQPPQ